MDFANDQDGGSLKYKLIVTKNENLVRMKFDKSIVNEGSWDADLPEPFLYDATEEINAGNHQV